MKIVIWGMGKSMRTFLNRKGLYKNDEIIAFIDNNQSLWGRSYQGIPVFPPNKLQEIEYDCVIICVIDNVDIKRQLIEKLGVERKKIKTITEINDYYTRKLIDRYKDVEDIEIQKAISCIEKKGLSVFTDYMPESFEDYDVFRDEGNHPYVVLNGNRMYYPDKYQFLKKENGKEFLPDIMYEQKKGSPHLYVKDENDIQPGAVIVDAGTCEGNFAIRFVEKASKIYLIESDPIWTDCLERTFFPFKEKVIICQKALSRFDSSTTITLDSLLGIQKIDFLKMDIEGAEIDALLGARNTLLKSNAKCSVCSYHKMDDEKHIRFILENTGYFTEVSNGYMFFLYDEDVFDTLDLRKGIVYAYKKKV